MPIMEESFKAHQKSSCNKEDKSEHMSITDQTMKEHINESNVFNSFACQEIDEIKGDGLYPEQFPELTQNNVIKAENKLQQELNWSLSYLENENVDEFLNENKSNEKHENTIPTIVFESDSDSETDSITIRINGKIATGKDHQEINARKNKRENCQSQSNAFTVFKERHDAKVIGDDSDTSLDYYSCSETSSDESDQGCDVQNEINVQCRNLNAGRDLALSSSDDENDNDIANNISPNSTPLMFNVNIKTDSTLTFHDDKNSNNVTMDTSLTSSKSGDSKDSGSSFDVLSQSPNEKVESPSEPEAIVDDEGLNFNKNSDDNEYLEDEEEKSDIGLEDVVGKSLKFSTNSDTEDSGSSYEILGHSANEKEKSTSEPDEILDHEKNSVTCEEVTAMKKLLQCSTKSDTEDSGSSYEVLSHYTNEEEILDEDSLSVPDKTVKEFSKAYQNWTKSKLYLDQQKERYNAKQVSHVLPNGDVAIDIGITDTSSDEDEQETTEITCEAMVHFEDNDKGKSLSQDSYNNHESEECKNCKKTRFTLKNLNDSTVDLLLELNKTYKHMWTCECNEITRPNTESEDILKSESVHNNDLEECLYCRRARFSLENLDTSTIDSLFELEKRNLDMCSCEYDKEVEVITLNDTFNDSKITKSDSDDILESESKYSNHFEECQYCKERKLSLAKLKVRQSELKEKSDDIWTEMDGLYVDILTCGCSGTVNLSFSHSKIQKSLMNSEEISETVSESEGISETELESESYSETDTESEANAASESISEADSEYEDISESDCDSSESSFSDPEDVSDDVSNLCQSCKDINQRLAEFRYDPLNLDHYIEFKNIMKEKRISCQCIDTYDNEVYSDNEDVNIADNSYSFKQEDGVTFQSLSESNLENIQEDAKDIDYYILSQNSEDDTTDISTIESDEEFTENEDSNVITAPLINEIIYDRETESEKEKSPLVEMDSDSMNDEVTAYCEEGASGQETSKYAIPYGTCSRNLFPTSGRNLFHLFPEGEETSDEEEASEDETLMDESAYIRELAAAKEKIQSMETTLVSVSDIVAAFAKEEASRQETPVKEMVCVREIATAKENSQSKETNTDSVTDEVVVNVEEGASPYVRKLAAEKEKTQTIEAVSYSVIDEVTGKAAEEGPNREEAGEEEEEEENDPICNLLTGLLKTELGIKTERKRDLTFEETCQRLTCMLQFDLCNVFNIVPFYELPGVGRIVPGKNLDSYLKLYEYADKKGIHL